MAISVFFYGSALLNINSMTMSRKVLIILEIFMLRNIFLVNSYVLNYNSVSSVENNIFKWWNVNICMKQWDLGK